MIGLGLIYIVTVSQRDAQRERLLKTRFHPIFAMWPAEPRWIDRRSVHRYISY